MSATPTSSAGTPVPTASALTSPYHYKPTESIGVIFVVLFSISTIIHFGQMVKYRLWWLIPTILLGGAGEITGWSGRLWSSFNDLAQDPFTIQIVCTIIAPTPFSAAIFITFGHIVRRLGQRYSWLTARKYARLFLTIDIVSLFVQASGGTIASGNNVSNTVVNIGSDIMLGGIVLQLAALLLFVLLAAHFFYCFFTDRPVRVELPSDGSMVTLINGRSAWNKKLKALSVALAVSSGLLIIRAVYRTIELEDGWNGRVISTQVYFILFDATMVVIAMFTLNFYHPGRLLFSQLDTAQDGFNHLNHLEKDNIPTVTAESIA